MSSSFWGCGMGSPSNSLRSGLLLLTVAALGIGALADRTAAPAPGPGLSAVAVLVAMTLGLWASGLISEALTTLVFFAGALLFRLATPEAVFAGLGSSAFWLVFSGLIIGAAIRATGLSGRIAAGLAPLLARSQAHALAGAACFGVFLAFLMPSAMGRVVLIIPLLQDLGERLGLEEGSPSRRGILVGGILGTALPSTAILPSNIPNNVLAAIYEGLFHRQMSYSDYLWQHFPVLGLVKALLLIALLRRFYRDAAPWRGLSAPGRMGPWSQAERRLSLWLGGAILLWLTDSLHHLSPAWVGLGVAIACLLPGIGVLPGDTLQRINLEPLLYVSGVVGLGAVISASGLGQQMALWLESGLPMAPAGGFGNFLALCGVSTLLGLLTTLPGVPAVLTPLTERFAAMSGLPASLVVATQVVGFSTLLLPYQAPPLVAALQLTSLSRREMAKILLALAGLSILVLWPIDYLWLSAVNG
ncbi:MAG: sodium/sulfate symporter [Rhodocyclaceae bacterium]|nr:sodium/sulfate symporter [Rhodocyclaceae bacterium]